MEDTYDPRHRLTFDGDVGAVFERLVKKYSLGELKDYRVVPVGYEDFNVILDTSKGRVFVKVFSKDRTHKEVIRFGEILAAVIETGVNHPSVYKYEGNVVYTDSQSQLMMIVMVYVEGQTFYDMNRVPDDEELRLILKQAVLINSTDLHPPYMYDSWAVQNTRKVYEEVKRHIPSNDKDLIEIALKDYENLNVEDLPQCFVHGDLVKSNVLKSKQKKMYVIDFSVANWYPRVQELAVIIANLMNDEVGTEDFDAVLKKVVNLYVELGGTITNNEKKALGPYVRVAYAAELVGAYKERSESDVELPENDYWLKLGRLGLERSSK